MREPSVQIVYTSPGGEGYHCVYHMARLAAELLQGELVLLHWGRFPTIKEKLAGLWASKKRDGVPCLLICPTPTDLNSALFLEGWRRRGRVAAWVFDSFWTSNIPQWIRYSRIFDHFFVTEQDDLGTWRNKTKAPVDWLPWGSDALNLGSDRAVRRFDLVRFGRQPSAWDDDDVNRAQCEARRIEFHGRPPSLEDATDNERGLMNHLSDTKFALAFTNRVSRSIQTHPDREYITGRWTDSLSSGASVAGIPPRSESVQSLLWPEALLDLGSVDQEEGLEVLSAAVRGWTPALAQLNYRKSLELLDWRWRFKTIADALEISAPLLDRDLDRLRGMARPLEAAGKAV